MSKLNGYKCDICGVEIDPRCRKYRIKVSWYDYFGYDHLGRMDFCQNCMRSFKEYVERKKDKG